MNETEHLWFRRRGYLHFDQPISLDKAFKIVSNPENVSKHSFFPFINFEVKSYKLKKDNVTNKLIKHDKVRPIAYSSHIDSHIYAYYASYLSALYEIQIGEYSLNDTILAFRALEKSNIHFAKTAFDCIKSTGECTAVALDLTGFFDNIDHEILKDRWAKIIGADKLPRDHFAIFKSITAYSKVNKDKLYETLKISKHNPKFCRDKVCSPSDFRNIVRKKGLIEKNVNKAGIPQGSPISALLSNIYMLNFDIDMKNYADSIGGHYYRYCDDMLFIVPSERKNEVAGIANQLLKELKVTLNTKKTEIRDFTFSGGDLKATQPLQYLGFIFDGKNIYLRSSSLSRYSDRMKRGVKLAKSTMKSRNKIRKSKGEQIKPLFKKKIYSRYSHFGKRNFLTYGFRAADIMQSKTIRKQLKPLWARLIQEIEKK
jgi:hypothetical protein